LNKIWIDGGKARVIEIVSFEEKRKNEKPLVFGREYWSMRAVVKTKPN